MKGNVPSPVCVDISLEHVMLCSPPGSKTRQNRGNVRLTCSDNRGTGRGVLQDSPALTTPAQAQVFLCRAPIELP